MSIDVRLTRPEEYRTAADTFAAALMTARIDDERWERSLPTWDQSTSYTAWDADRCVGHACHFWCDTTVPGGAALTTGAVSRVGVLTTARRQGVASRLMHALIHDAAEQGWPLMSLRASQATIYERFGFGMAGEFTAVTIDPRAVLPIRGAEHTGSFRILRPEEILEVVPPLYERVGRRRIGAITRPTSWNRRLFLDAIDGSKASFVAVHTNVDGVDDGYVHYETEWHEDHPDFPQGRGEVLDLFGATDAVELALWDYICRVDLVTKWKSNERPLDDALRLAAHDSRGYRVRSVDDEQWVRLVDVDVALSSRAYRPVSGSVRVQISDPVLPANDGVWEIDADGARRTDSAPDLVTTIAGVSAAYLGGTSWSVLAATGRVTGSSEAVALADALFAVAPLPFCGTFF